MVYDKVLIINSYAGSLTVAASQGGYKILASMEDCGYGLDAQRANFPNLTYVPELPWPAAYPNLEGSITLAHPPCAAFSGQNSSANKGITSTHFDCTRRIIDYCGMNGAPAVLIESVHGALEGAREFYDTYPQRYNYNAYRVLQNAVTFGVPQWRPRYWTVLIRDGLLAHTLNQLILRHRRRYVSLADALGPTGITAEANETVTRQWIKQRDGMLAGGVTETLLAEMLLNNIGHGCHVLAALFDLEPREAAIRFGLYTFLSRDFRLLDSNGYASTLMCDSLWILNGRPLNRAEYNVVGGFPADYKFPKDRQQREYLSKGVAPPVALWLLNEVRCNLENNHALYRTQTPDRVYEIGPGETADLRVTKKEAYAKTP